MDMSRLGSVFNRRSSRRDAIRYTGLGLGAAALGTPLVRQATFAQESTPDPQEDHLGLPEGERTFFMFIQTAQGGTWEPKPDEEGVYTLTLTGLPAQTVYFSDRPERIVGHVSTDDFLQGLGFDEENPPNAALVTKADDGQDDILVIELFNPVYTEGEGAEGATLVYDARILENYHQTELGRVALEQDDSSIPSSFDHASLFIDDCADGHVNCVRRSDDTVVTGFAFGCCWKGLSCQYCWDYSGICHDVAGCENNSCGIQTTRPCML